MGAPIRSPKAAALVLLALTASTGLAACGGESSADTGGKTTLVVANSQWLDPDRGEGLWKAMKEFEKANPSIELEQEAAPGPEIGTRLTTELGAGKGPDVMVLQDTLFQSFVEADFLAPLPGSVTDGVELNATNEGAVIDGERLGVAWQQAPFGIVYNKALLAKAGVEVPTTPEELVAAAKAVHDKTGAIGFGDQDIAVNTGSWTQQLDSWTFGYGGSWEKDGKLTIDTPENVAGVAAFAKVAKSGIMQSEGYNTIIGAYSQGQVGMLTTCGCGAIGAALGGHIKSTDIGVAPTPTPQNIGFAQQLYVSVNAKSAQQAAAKKFVSWLISAEGQKALRDASGPDALATDVPLSAAYAEANPWAEQFAELGLTSRSTLIPGYETQTGQIMQIIADKVQAVVVDGVDPEKALSDAAAEVASQVG